MTAAIKVVELRLRNGVIDVDRREQKLALLLHLVKTMHTRGRLLRHAANVLLHLLKALAIGAQRLLELREENLFLFVVCLAVQDLRLRQRLMREMHEQRRVAAVVENHVRTLAVTPVERAIDVLPVFLEGLALVCEDRSALGGNRGCSLVLRREDVAARPAHLGTKRLERLDEHGRLDRHVQRAGDARTLERLSLAVFITKRHEPGHLCLGQLDLLATPRRELNVLDVVVLLGSHRTYS